MLRGFSWFIKGARAATIKQLDRAIPLHWSNAGIVFYDGTRHPRCSDSQNTQWYSNKLFISGISLVFQTGAELRLKSYLLINVKERHFQIKKKFVFQQFFFQFDVPNFVIKMSEVRVGDSSLPLSSFLWTRALTTTIIMLLTLRSYRHTWSHVVESIR